MTYQVGSALATKEQIGARLQLVIDGVASLLKYFALAGESVSATIANDTINGDDPLGLRPLAIIIALSEAHMGPLQCYPERSSQFHQLLQAMTTLYVLENITDDLSIIDTPNNIPDYRYASTMSCFYVILEQLIEDEIDLDYALHQVGLLPTAHISIPYLDHLLDRYPLPARVNSLLALHVLAVAGVCSNLAAFEHSLPGLHRLTLQAQSGLLNRYCGSRKCMEQPSVSIEEALERGKETILTDFHCPYVLLSAASVDPAICLQLAEEMDAVLVSIAHSSYLHRILNDAGLAGIRPHEVLDALAGLATTSSVCLSPRAYIAACGKMMDPSARKFIARLIKDADEHEANMVLDARHHVAQPQSPALLIRYNLLFLHQQSKASLTILKAELSAIAHPFVHGLISNFLEFQRRIYSILVEDGGEYIGAKKTMLFNSIMEILQEPLPMAFIDRMLEQCECLYTVKK